MPGSTDDQPQRPISLLKAMHTATHTLLDSDLSPQQRLFIQHIANHTDRLLTLLDGIPQTRFALRQIIPPLSDDLTQSMTTITGYAQLLLHSPQSFDGATLTDVQATHVRTLYQTTRTLTTLVDQLKAEDFDYRRQQRTAAPTTFDLNMLIWQHIPLYRYWIREDAVKLLVNFPQGLPPIHGMPYHIAEITRHIITTIARDLLEYGTIDISAQYAPDKAQVELAIAGSGLRLLPDDMAILFEQNGRHIYRQRIAEQGGTLRVERENGIGAAVILGLPTAARITS